MNFAPLQSFLRIEQDRAAATFVLDEELGTHHGLSWSDFVLLHTLEEDGRGLPQPQLAMRLGLRGSKLLMQIRPLEKLGLLSRSGTEGGPIVILRPAGHRVLREARETAAAVCARVGTPDRHATR
jgi:MarR family transcriptional regulator, organic hydroperoxide resistance regulator